ncbi:hypothetical protein [Colwellia sp. MT41]|uniref:hypothetical protein n=1 Tax=Colwellia sp. MT41 TaxID=58049 RepID=UPI000AAA0318|nr:hypothetical protein [Colwellia sp. MT41]
MAIGKYKGVLAMQWLWTWKGKSFGFRNNDELRLQDGTHVATFRGDEVFDFQGHYLGEIRSENRLITKKSSKRKKRSRSSKKMKMVARVGRVNYVANVNIIGHENFPEKDSFGR